jgi:putative SbcD/Mre11-related phosphoesterase
LIEIGDIVIVPGYPAITSRDKKTVVIADLHLGYEEAMAREGVYLPYIQLTKAIKLIQDLQRITGASTLVINGDIKNSFDKLTSQERIEIIKFFAKGKELYENIILVRGNHDNYVPIITSRMDIELVEKYRLTNETLVIHGHKIPEDFNEYKLVVIGHEHPSFTLKDELGSITKVPCFLKVPTTIGNTVLVMPAAGYYQTGNPISLDRNNYLSPILRKYGVIEEAVPIIVDIEGGTLFEFPPLKETVKALESMDISI